MKRALTLFVFVFLLMCGTADARTFTSPGEMKAGEYKYVQNPDGTYTEYYMGNTGELPVRGDTYSAEGIDESDRVFSEVGVDEGTTGQDAGSLVDGKPIVEGATSDNVSGAEDVWKAFETDVPYRTPGEAVAGDELISEGVAEGTLPSLGAIATSTLGGTVAVAGGAVVAGVALGAGVDQLLGFIEIGELLGTSNGNIKPGCYFSGESECKWKGEWLGEIRIGNVGACEAKEFLSPFSVFALSTSEEVCLFPEVKYKIESEVTEYNSHTEKVEKHKHGCTSFGGDGGNYAGAFEDGECTGTVPNSCPAAWGIRCESGYAGPGGDIYTTPQPPESGYNYYYSRLWVGLLEAVGYASFPDNEELFGSESHVITPPPGHVEPIAPLKATLAPPPPATVPAPVRHKIIEKAKKPETEKEKEEEEKGKKAIPKPLIPPIEEGGEIPDPSKPVVPQPKPGGEMFPEYAKDVEKAGFTVTPESYTLPESDIDTSVGPGDVAAPDISPEPGTSSDPDTKIRVGVNPSDAPPDEGSKGGVSPPDIPGIHTPNLGVFCTTFPFGIPCWLYETAEKWTATEQTPEVTFHIELPAVVGRSATCLCGTVSFAPLNPYIETLKPYIDFLIAMGVIVTFGAWMLGRGYGTTVEDGGQVAMTGPGF